MGRSGDLVHTVNFDFELSSPDYSLTLRPSALTVPLGGRAQVVVDVQPLDGFQGVVRLTLDNLPPGIESDTVDVTTGSSGVLNLSATALPGNDR